MPVCNSPLGVSLSVKLGGYPHHLVLHIKGVIRYHHESLHCEINSYSTNTVPYKLDEPTLYSNSSLLLSSCNTLHDLVCPRYTYQEWFDRLVLGWDRDPNKEKS